MLFIITILLAMCTCTVKKIKKERLRNWMSDVRCQTQHGQRSLGQSSQLTEPLWTDPGIKSGISVHELFVTLSVNVGAAPASAAVQQPVVVASIPAGAFVAATQAVNIPVNSPVLFVMTVFYCFAYDRLFLIIVRITTNLIVDWSV